MGTLAADFSALKASLFERVRQKASGTLFVATVDNHAAQIVLSRGQLLGVAHNGLCNESALNQLAATAPLRFSFTPELIYPLMETLLPEQAEQLLQRLGYSEADGETSTAELEAEPEIEPQAEPADEPPAAAAGKTLRVYRGRVIQP